MNQFQIKTRHTSQSRRQGNSPTILLWIVIVITSVSLGMNVLNEIRIQKAYRMIDNATKELERSFNLLE